jgi:hypothetical protein
LRQAFIRSTREPSGSGGRAKKPAYEAPALIELFRASAESTCHRLEFREGREHREFPLSASLDPELTTSIVATFVRSRSARVAIRSFG